MTQEIQPEKNCPKGEAKAGYPEACLYNPL